MPGTFEPEFESKFLAFWAEVRREGDFQKNTLNTFKSNNYNAVVNAEDPGKFRKLKFLNNNLTLFCAREGGGV